MAKFYRYCIRFVFLILLVFSILIAPQNVKAQNEAQTDWVIRDFKTDIVVKSDSSAQITETITADCGNLPDKHGIFRVLPTKIKVDNGASILTPINLVSITDLNGNAYHYSTSKDTFANTLTWKIGDPNKTVTGVNYYKITYNVGNVIRFQNGFEEFYWNLSGNFWQIPIEKFSANIIFPQNAQLNKTKISLYSGAEGAKTQGDSSYNIVSSNQLVVSENSELNPGEGVTLSSSFASGTFTPYKFSFWFLYGDYLFWLIPLFIFIINYLLWLKYGRDPKINGPIVPEFEIPENLDPITMGSIESQSGLEHNSIAAAIIYFATRKLIKIEEIPAKNIFMKKDYLFRDISTSDQINTLAPIEKQLFDIIFSGQKEVNLSSIKDSLRIKIFALQEDAKDGLTSNGYLIASSGKIMGNAGCLRSIFYFTLTLLTIAIIYFYGFSLNVIAAMVVSYIILIFFTALAPKYTQKGAELNHKIKGFKLFIETAEKYRAQFQEKEGIFEKFLPYAILFGLTKIWIDNMKSIYGNDYFTTHPMYFYVGGTGNIADFDSLNSAISGISSSVSSSTGAGGAGGAGGGGGGGGGGGW